MPFINRSEFSRVVIFGAIAGLLAAVFIAWARSRQLTFVELLGSACIGVILTCTVVMLRNAANPWKRRGGS